MNDEQYGFEWFLGSLIGLILGGCIGFMASFNHFNIPDEQKKCNSLGGEFHVLDNINGISISCMSKAKQLDL